MFFCSCTKNKLFYKAANSKYERDTQNYPSYMSQVLLAKLNWRSSEESLVKFWSHFFLPKQSRDLVQRLIGKLCNYSRSAQRDFSSTALGKLDMSPHASEIAPKLIFFLQKAIISRKLSVPPCPLLHIIRILA